jgi:hypothetical protein
MAASSIGREQELAQPLLAEFDSNLSLQPAQIPAKQLESFCVFFGAPLLEHFRYQGVAPCLELG